ncbi:hypothetical protein D9M71_473540 [compost metagenome]
MGAEAVQFLGHVAFLRQQHQFLLQALGVQLRFHLGEAVEDLLPLGGEHLRNQRAQGGDFILHGIQTLVEQAGQVGTFAAAAFLQLVQGLGEDFQGGAVEGLRVGGIGHQHAGPGEDFQGVERGRLLDQRGDALGGLDQLAGAVAVYLQGLAGVFFGQAQGAFHLAARQALAQGLAHRAFEVAEGFRQAQVGFEVAVVHRAQFPAQGAVGAGPFDAGEGGHAVHHGISSRFRRSKEAIVAQPARASQRGDVALGAGPL